MFRFPWGDFHSLNLGWFLQKFNELREDWATAEAGIDGALDAEIQKAEDALTDVFAARDAAAASASAANSSALNASQSSLASMDARDQSRAARDAAQQAAGNAAASETAAGNSATAASNSAGAATTSATQAGNSATAAQNSATAAGNSATAAGNSATAAGNSATAAGNSAGAAAQSAENAEYAAASVEASSQQITTNKNNIDDLFDSLILSSGFPLIGANNNKITSVGVDVTKRGNIFKFEGTRNGSLYIGANGEISSQNAPSLVDIPQGTYRIIFRGAGFVESPTLTGEGIALFVDKYADNTFTNLIQPRPAIPIANDTDQKYIKEFILNKNFDEPVSFRIYQRATSVNIRMEIEIYPYSASTFTNALSTYMTKEETEIN